MNLEIKELALKAVTFGQEIRAERPILMDLRNLTAMTDYFVIMSAANKRQVEAIADNIKLSFKDKFDILPEAEERDEKSHWILLDYGDFVVHVFLDETREFYDLERLWGDADITEVV